MTRRRKVAAWVAALALAGGAAAGVTTAHHHAPAPAPAAPPVTTSVRIATQNLNFSRPGDDQQIAWLRTRADVIAYQERCHRCGNHEVSLSTPGSRATVRRLIEVGHSGGHRYGACGTITLDTTPVRICSVHSPHPRIAGKAGQAAYFRALAVYTTQLRADRQSYVIAGDFNRGGARVARIIGGHFYGFGVDGFITWHVKITHLRESTVLKRRGLTDHPTVLGVLVAS